MVLKDPFFGHPAFVHKIMHCSRICFFLVVEALHRTNAPNMKLKDITKIFVSLVLVITYVILFGRESVNRLWAGDTTIVRNEESPENISSPGINTFMIISSNDFFVLMLNNE